MATMATRCPTTGAYLLMQLLGLAVKVSSGGPVTSYLLGETLLQGTLVSGWAAMAALVAWRVAIMAFVMQPGGMMVAPLMGTAFEKGATSLLRPFTTSVPCVRPLIAALSGLRFDGLLGPKVSRPFVLEWSMTAHQQPLCLLQASERHRFLQQRQVPSLRQALRLPRAAGTPRQPRGHLRAEPRAALLLVLQGAVRL